MPTLRELQAEWNTLVDVAHGLGMYNVRRIRTVHENIAVGTRRVASLRTRIENRQARLGRFQAPAPAPHLATSEEFTFGVELEFYMPRGMSASQLATVLTGMGVPCYYAGYTHDISTSWKLVTDGSLGDISRGIELVSPKLRGEAGLRQLARACEVLQAEGCNVGRKCGFHVHVGRIDDYQLARHLVRMYYNNQAVIDTFMAPSRRGPAGGGGFCGDVRMSTSIDRATSMDDVVRACGQTASASRDDTRYRKLNLKSWYKYHTVEFRHHQGSIDPQKTAMWVRLCLEMVERARRGEQSGPQTLDSFLSGLPQDMAVFFRSRVEFFTGAVRRAA